MGFVSLISFTNRMTSSLEKDIAPSVPCWFIVERMLNCFGTGRKSTIKKPVVSIIPIVVVLATFDTISHTVLSLPEES